jgi:hypothetical protein
MTDDGLRACATLHVGMPIKTHEIVLNKPVYNAKQLYSRASCGCVRSIVYLSVVCHTGTICATVVEIGKYSFGSHAVTVPC